MAVVRRKRGTRVNGKDQFSYQVRWRYLGNGAVQTTTMDNAGDAKAMDQAIAGLHYAILKTDPRVVTRSLIGAQVEQTEEARQEATTRSLTVRQAFEAWMVRPGVSEGTRRSNVTQRGRLEHGGLADRPLGSLTDQDLQAWFRGLEERGLKHSTLEVQRASVRAALDRAGYGHLVSAEWYKHADTEGDPVYLTEEQAAVLLAGLKDAELQLLAKVLLYCGLRIGEALGLQVRHLDLTLDAGCIHVKQQLPARARTSVGFVTEKPKTKKTKRVPVPVPDWLAWELREHVKGLPDGAVVFHPRGREFWVRKTLQDRWRVAVQACDGVPAHTTPHDLRHTFAKTSLEDGMPSHILARIMGNSVKTIEKTYAGFGDSSLALARDIMNRRPGA